jgi:aspartyl-tRNA(Asn)/glutamyl-tRNA(Gln) amidotransferase subunit C
LAVARSDVERVAALARLELTDDELDSFAREMSGILEFFRELTTVDTDGIEPAFRVLRRTNVLREDVPGEMLTAGEALANAPDAHEGAFRVPDVLPDD